MEILRSAWYPPPPQKKNKKKNTHTKKQQKTKKTNNNKNTTTTKNPSKTTKKLKINQNFFRYLLRLFYNAEPLAKMVEKLSLDERNLISRSRSSWLFGSNRCSPGGSHHCKAFHHVRDYSFQENKWVCNV